MVVMQKGRAACIGIHIPDRSGDAVDTAIAVGFAMALSYPRAGSLGGGCVMMIHLAKDNHNITIDYGETAPTATTPTSFLDA